MASADSSYDVSFTVGKRKRWSNASCLRTRCKALAPTGVEVVAACLKDGLGRRVLFSFFGFLFDAVYFG